ncbi:EAL domain-containing protein [Aliivibrio fischeri]|uniref:EAL domain-containing protein n=1 Tax=Aliivibrio fischeri TaxID=668 RepID=UPI0007C4DC8E|nr:EAL domain-containing protein [Aliivibrio fischeri]TGA70293.1 EAL domain-containing protein [Aliivibrio fischeri]
MYSKIFFMYQPKFHYNDVCGYEALLRAVLDDGRIAFPELLIEKHRTEISFDYFIIDKVISELSRPSYSEIRKYPISINVSSQFMSTEIDIEEFNLETVDEFNLQLEFEILESDKISDFEVCNKNISLLFSLGILVSLDDFGSEYCSIERLSRLQQIKFVKLDKSLIDNIENSPFQLIVLKAICKLIKEFNFDILVEGVENQETYHLLIQLDIAYFQGFYFGKPMLIH